MKYLKYFLIGGIVLLTSSFTTRTSGISEGISLGNLSPELNLENKFSLRSLKGQKILVNFWAAYDAESHMRNVQLWNALKKEGHQVVMVSVSFDKSKSVFEKTLNIDEIDGEYQFLDTKGLDSEIFKTYRLEKGFGSYLLDENGVIIAKNLTPVDLNRLL